MAINFVSALGGHEQALLVREQRAGLLAANLANADTPGYQARDIDFRALIGAAMAAQSTGALAQTRPGHLAAGARVDGNVLYRVPQQPTLDGNSVDSAIETVEFARNALDFQASLTFLQGKFRGLRTALKGE